jgi:Glycosyltransferase family 9 (heptosyltransferase)
LESIYNEPGSTCNDLLGYCLRGEPWPSDLLDRAIQVDDGRALLSIVVERLADLFEPRLCGVYRRLFTEVIERVAPDLCTRLRLPAENNPPRHTDRVYVLSRVTLGADVAVTSVLLDAAKRRYPDAEIFFAGPQKSHEMFQADSRIRHFPAPYARGGSLADRLRASAALWFHDGIVIDPDSRLTQLGLISVCDESRYFFFNSRAIQVPGDGPGRLPDLAARWAKDIFGVDAQPFVAPPEPHGEAAEITVSLGVGENESKRLGDDFERDLVRLLAGRSVLIDKGGSAEERARVERALLPGMRAHEGSFASFAAEIARSKLFIGYDSAGGHVAAACGIPVISIFAGAVNDRFFERWKPLGQVIRAEDRSALARIAALI